MQSGSQRGLADSAAGTVAEAWQPVLAARVAGGALFALAGWLTLRRTA